MKTKRILSIMLIFCMAVALMPVMPMPANAADAVTLASTIEDFDHGGTGALTATASGYTVTVTGTVTGATNSLALNISSGLPSVTVRWLAQYAGTHANYLIQLSGGGIFEVAAGGSIKNSGAGNAISTSSNTINITGGIVSSAGTVNTTCIIINYSGKINVSGGAVSSKGIALSTKGSNSAINVSGGEVKSEYHAIWTEGANTVITVSNGVLSTTSNSAAIACSASVGTTIDISGGFIFARKATNVVNMNNGGTPAISGNAVVCAWDKPSSGTPTYDDGTSTNLAVNSGATANWGIKPAMGGEPAQNGIVYIKGTNTGFFPIDGIIINSVAAPSPTPPAATPAPTAIPHEWANPFVDVKTGDWFYNDVRFAHTNGLFNGISDNEFGPSLPMTRAMIITVLARYAKVDTSGEPWYAKAVAWGVANGITDGSNLNGNVTREQLATLLWRYAEEPAGTGDLSGFSDNAKVSTYAIDAMKWANAKGLIKGYEDSTLRPQGNATRAEVAAIMHRFVEAAK